MTTNKFDMYTLTDEYDALPRHLISQVQDYVNNYYKPCNFLECVFANDLERAVAYADTRNQELLHTWVKLLFNNVPCGCWGSTAKVEAWLRK